MTFLESYFQGRNSSSWSLGVDTSTHQGRLSFFNKSGVLKEVIWGKEKRHSESLLLDFKEITSELKLDIVNLNHIFLGVGPGSFTGVRVSCAFVKGLSFASNVEVKAFPSTRIQAAQIALRKTDFVFLLPSIGELVFSAKYTKKNNLYIEDLSPTTKPIKHFLDLGKEEVFIFKDQEKNSITSKVQQKINSVSNQTPSLYESLVFSHENLLPFCSSTHLDLIPLYFRLSEAEEKFGIKEGK